MENMCKTCVCIQVCKHAVKAEEVKEAYTFTKKQFIVECKYYYNKDQKVAEAEREAHERWRENHELEKKISHKDEEINNLKRKIKTIQELMGGKI